MTPARPLLPDELPLGAARLVRASEIRRIRFDDFLEGPGPQGRRRTAREALPVVPIEAVAPGDNQVFAAREPGKVNSPIIDLDVLAEFPSVESIIGSTRVRTARELPAIREVLMIGHQLSIDTATLAKLSGIESLYIPHLVRDKTLDLGCLPASSMRQLAIWRWDVDSLAPLAKMTALRQLDVTLFHESLELLSKMHDLTFLRVLGPAKGWASLRECTQLETASLIDIQMANLKRWNTWNSLRAVCLGGRGLKSLSGIGAWQQLESLHLLNFRTGDLSPLCDLTRLTEVTCRMPDRSLDLASLARVPALRRLEIDEAPITDMDIVRLPSIEPLSRAPALEEIVLMGTRVEDGDLMPLAAIERLRRVRLGDDIGCDVDKLRDARPDLTIEYTPRAGTLRKFEKVGQVTVYPPSEGIETWSIFDNLATALRVQTNYAAEQLIRREVKKISQELLKRLDWDTEAGAVGIYAAAEQDIHTVAEVVNRLLAVLT
jgi:hypothetical protein